MGDVLLLDEGDFLVQPPPHIGQRKICHVHIIVHRLLFRRGNGHRRQHRPHVRRLIADDSAHVVDRIAVVRDRRPSGHNLRVAPHQLFRIDALLALQKVGVPVKVVEILEQGKIERLFHIAVLFLARQLRRQIHRQLFVGNGVFENGFVGGLQQGELLLLLFFDKAGQCQLAAQIVVVGVAGKLMGEPIRFKFRAVGQNDPRLGIGIDRPFIVRPGIELPPVLKCLVNGTRSFRKRVHIVTPCKIFHLQLYAKPRGGCALRAGRSFVLFFYCQSATSTHFLKNAFSSSVLFAVCVAATMGRILST